MQAPPTASLQPQPGARAGIFASARAHAPFALHGRPAPLGRPAAAHSCPLTPLTRTSGARGPGASHSLQQAAVHSAASLCRGQRRCLTVAAGAAPASDLPDAILFDCDGVLLESEADGHRVSFNKAFEQLGLDHQWDEELYGRLLETGGGKERMTVYFREREDQEPFKSLQGEARQELVRQLHSRKTELFAAMVESGELPLRPGVRRLVSEAAAAGVPVAVCSTSNERSVAAVVRLLGPELADNIRIFAGDVVPKKKPDPAIYLLAAQELGLDPARTVVIEDSRIGMLAAKGAGMRCLITKSRYTGGEDFSAADAVFDCIGEADAPRFSLADVLTTTG